MRKSRPSLTPLNDGDLASPAYSWRDDHFQPGSSSSSWLPTPSPSYEAVSKNDYELTTISRPSLSQRKTETAVDGSQVSLLGAEGSDGYRNQSRWKRLRRKYSGWRAGLVMSSCCTGAVFLLNVFLTIWATQKFGTSNGYGVLISGSCATTKRASTWIHLGINVLSTLLLSASNYCMQILTAPTRSEIDLAHSKGTWLDIGVPSMRNLRWISRYRVCIWILLAGSSLPLHLLYNSAVYDTLTANVYTVYGGSKDIDSWTNYTQGTIGGYSASYITPKTGTIYEMVKQGQGLDRLEPRDCITAYGKDFVSDRRDVVLVLNETGKQPDDQMFIISLAEPRSDPASWMCTNIHQQGPCEASVALPTVNDWRYFDSSGQIFTLIEYCLSEKVDEHCELQFSVPIIVIVIIANLIKLLCMLYTVRTHRMPTIVTVGDAIASFLQNPDPTTDGRCTLSNKGVVNDKKWTKRPTSLNASRVKEFVPPEPQPWVNKRGKWLESASAARWTFCYACCIVTIIVGAVLEINGETGLRNSEIATDLKSLWGLGFGAVNADSLVSIEGLGIVGNTLLANAAQVVLSFLYLSYNSIFTCQLLSAEWTSYTQKRKALRVTSPKGAQRSTYFLQLPYTYSIPLLAFSGLLHWLVSQSIFLAQINVFDEEGELDTGEVISRCGYSCIAIICVLTVGCILIAAGFLNGFRRYPDGIPLAATCSAAISAACHPPAADANAAFKEVQYGEVEVKDGVRHCAFTSRAVTRPMAGELYA